jgi:hypothetical protein
VGAVDDDPRVVLVGRSGCHLCDLARDVVARVTGDLGVAWVERSVDGDPVLLREYSDMVPVVLVDGERHAYWRVDEQRLRTALTSPVPGPSSRFRWDG